MAHFLSFCPQIRQRVWSWRRFTGKLRGNLDACVTQGARLLRIVGEKANSAEAKVVQDCNRQTEISAISLEPQRMISVNRVQASILQRVSLQLSHQADAS